MRKGLFVVVDGPSASGKDTIIERVLKDLNRLKINAFLLEETKEKNYDRKKILQAKEKGDKETAKAIISERKKLYQKRITPWLLTSKIVIANRGESTTLAYQTIKGNITMNEVWEMHRANNIPLPDLFVITNCSVKEAIRRENLRKTQEEQDKKSMSGKFTSDRVRIHRNYEKVKDFLDAKGVPVIYLNTEELSLSEESQIIMNYIKNKIKYSL